MIPSSGENGCGGSSVRVGDLSSSAELVCNHILTAW
jgi:hypothetical protein